MREPIIRFAEEKDAPALLAIYAHYVTDTAITFECDVPSAEEFARRITEIKKRYPYLIAEQNGKILGYAYASPFKNRDAYDWSVETSIYIDKNARRLGIGKLLYSQLETILKKQGVTNLYACIAFTEKNDEYLNNDSVIFHKKVGYTTVGKFISCGYKFNKWYNMAWMEKIIGSYKENQPPLKPWYDVCVTKII